MTWGDGGPQYPGGAAIGHSARPWKDAMTTRDTRRPPSAEGRRTIPLREVTLPHSCPRTVRMYVLARAPYFLGLGEPELDGIDRRMRTASVPAGTAYFTPRKVSLSTG